ncbi:MAG: radical SAM/SPASM domain-containing protein [Campylobacterota bacterium]|nr:radical SAM/SPASM domain-containing protein [Campylobacterota bacterium]
MKFHRVYIEITDICGLSCSFCTTQPANRTMSLEHFELIISQVKDYTQEVALHMMGDPLVLSNLKEYLEILQRHKLRAFITTSGYYTAKHHPTTLLHEATKQINISINSYNKNQNTLTLDEYLAPIFDLIEYKLSHNIDKFINLRLWNLDESLSERAFNQSFFDRVSARFDITLNSDEIYRQQPKNIRIASKTLLHFDSYFEWPSLDNPIYGNGRCQGLSSHFGILSNGKVVPCCLDSQGVITLGDITKEPLEEIFHSHKTKNIIDGFKKGIATEELCQKCSYKKRFDTP